MKSTPFSWVISYGQVGHLNYVLGLPLVILFKLYFEITCPHFKSIGLLFVSFETGQIKILWNEKSYPKLTSQGISLLILED